MCWFFRSFRHHILLPHTEFTNSQHIRPHFVTSHTIHQVKTPHVNVVQCAVGFCALNAYPMQNALTRLRLEHNLSISTHSPPCLYVSYWRDGASVIRFPTCTMHIQLTLEVTRHVVQQI